MVPLVLGLTNQDTCQRSLNVLTTFALSHQQDNALPQMQIVILFTSMILVFLGEESNIKIITTLESFNSKISLFRKTKSKE